MVMYNRIVFFLSVTIKHIMFIYILNNSHGYIQPRCIFLSVTIKHICLNILNNNHYVQQRGFFTQCNNKTHNYNYIW